MLDILRSNELFAPHVVDLKGRNEDPVTTDLVGALLLVRKHIGRGMRRRLRCLSILFTVEILCLS